MQALIDPTAQVQYVSSWTTDTPPQPVFSTYPNSERICEVAATAFDVAPPLFWIDCADNIIANQYYYDSVSQTINPIVNVPPPSA
jgi:hypothetical protein